MALMFPARELTSSVTSLCQSRISLFQTNPKQYIT